MVIITDQFRSLEKVFNITIFLDNIFEKNQSRLW